MKESPIMLITPDFTESTDFAPITPGTYKSRILTCESKTSKKGDTYLRWELEVFGAEDTKVNNRKFWYNTMLSGKGAGGLKKLLAVTVGPVDGAFDTESLYGKTVQVVLVQGKDQHGNPSDYPDVKSLAKLAE